MSKNLRSPLLPLIVFMLGAFSCAQSPQAAAQNHTAPTWVQRSNEDAMVLLTSLARFEPESAAFFGVEGYDEQVLDLKPDYGKRRQEAVRKAMAELQSKLAAEKDPAVREDLQILIKSAQDDIHDVDLHEKYEVPYFNLSRLYFNALRTLLDDQASPERRQHALVRLKRYVGMEPGYTPLTELAMVRTREHMGRPGLLYPFKGEVEKDLANSDHFMPGIEQLFKKFNIQGYEQPYAKLKGQIAAYNDFVRKEVLPKARTDFRLPPEEYVFALEQAGVDIPPAQLVPMAHAAFDDIQKQMQVLAAQVAQQRGWKVTDYRDVIHELKQDQLVGDAILPHYQNRLKQIEDIIRTEHLVSLPNRPARIRLASAAESANTPAPHLHPPRLLGNTGQEGEFVLPLNIPAPPGSKEAMQNFDDFTFAAASWTLTAHEARPGHELQFASIIEKGVSIARAVFAFNSTNVEGWGLYSEAITKPYMPTDGQLISLQHRLLRAARAFLDPELESGKITPEQAKALLMKDVVMSDAMANEEVERYTFWAPGQAPSYFYGYTRLMELRADTEKALGSRFNQQKYHDFVLSEGLVPPGLLRKAVMEQFIPGQGEKPAQAN
jgi:hypothetical protein